MKQIPDKVLDELIQMAEDAYLSNRVDPLNPDQQVSYCELCKGVDDHTQECWLGQAIRAQWGSAGWRMVPIEPTQAMLDAARNWSYAKYGKPVGNDGATGCYRAMVAMASEAPSGGEAK